MPHYTKLARTIWRCAVTAIFTIQAAYGAGPEDPQELEAFIDGFMASALDAHHTAGATVSVVKDGELFFAKGYGEADVENHRKVHAESTLFRIGSVSKLFVWTAVMQQVEQGRIDLDADLNLYLSDFQIPDTYAEPITMASLLSHSPGFEDRVIGLFAKSADALAPLGQLVAEQLPKRVRPPMIVSSYSNHGAALAAHIVELVSGQLWDEYVEEHIFKPLGMEHTTFRQPLPERFAENMSKGYRWDAKNLVEEGFEFVPIAPAGSATATATDMARFMIAHLQQGRYGENRILQETTARRMHGELFRHAEGIDAMAHGFYQLNQNGQHIIGHGGDTLWFHTQLALLPEHNLGFYVSFNSKEGFEARGRFIEEFIDRYFPADDLPVPIPHQATVQNLARYAGYYRVNRFPHTTLAKMMGLMQTIRFDDDGNGALTTAMTGNTRWISVSPERFEEEDGERAIVFRKDDQGRVTHAFLSDFPVIAFERVDFFADIPAFNLGLLALAMPVFLWIVTSWPVLAFLRWRYDAQVRASSRLPRFSRVIAWLTALAFLAFAASLIVALAPDPGQIVFGVPKILQYALVLPLIASLLSVVALGCALRAWTNAQGKVFARIRYSAATLLFFAVIAQLYYWNLLGFQY